PFALRSGAFGADRLRELVARERPLLRGAARAGLQDRQQRESADGAERHLDELVAARVVLVLGEHDAAEAQRLGAQLALDRRERRAQLGVGARGGGEVDGRREQRSGGPAPAQVGRGLAALRAARELRALVAEEALAALGELGERLRHE